MHSVPVGKRALFYEGPYYMFSNFSAFAVNWKGAWWPTAEHAYQAAKFFEESPSIAEEIKVARSAHEAKKIASLNQDHVDASWGTVKKLAVMEEILWAKVHSHEYVRQRLLATGSKHLIENSPNDEFWGRGRYWNGTNHLGLIWMKIRTDLKPMKA